MVCFLGSFLGHYHTRSARLRRHDLRGNRVRFVLDVEHAVLAQVSQALKEELATRYNVLPMDDDLARRFDPDVAVRPVDIRRRGQLLTCLQ